MDHSVKGYLSRQSHEELKKLLEYCIKEGNTNPYRHLDADIQCVLSGGYTPADIDVKYDQSMRVLRVKDDD